jgi:hypothetical protein
MCSLEFSIPKNSYANGINVSIFGQPLFAVDDFPRLSRNKVRDFWAPLDVELVHPVLLRAIRISHTLVLAQMFKPGLHHKCFHHSALLASVFEHAPRAGSVATPFLCQGFKRSKKFVAIFWLDSVLDSDQDRPLILLHLVRCDRSRPVH